MLRTTKPGVLLGGYINYPDLDRAASDMVEYARSSPFRREVAIRCLVSAVLAQWVTYEESLWPGGPVPAPPAPDYPGGEAVTAEAERLLAEAEEWYDTQEGAIA